ncbi:unnamed protein product [Eruca vesicaria subsp. sativa]|uniref:Uncharacterized protein n=1 Tax=Eruca vesicaria subsp. sativa TaxID=29727 RepID=A0ABC8JS51_ERUVS|nr:unnamed protein product [Eruca vesicaria subsp. sativa]
MRRLGVQQWPQFDRDRIFCSVPHILAATWGSSSDARASRRERVPASLLHPSSSSHGAVRSSPVCVGGVHRAIPYADVLSDVVASSSLRGGHRGMAKSNPLNSKVEPERAVGGSGEVSPVVPRDEGPTNVGVLPTGGFMADAIGSSLHGLESLKRPSEDVLAEDASGETLRPHGGRQLLNHRSGKR